MKLTNKYGLPEAFVRAVENDPYTKGGADFSITQLISPARIGVLEQRHYAEIEEDASDRVFSLLGQSVHHMLERLRRDCDLVEKRFFATFLDYSVSGQIDLLSNYQGDSAALSDWKVTKAYPFTKKAGRALKPEWVAQLNMQLELLRQNGLDAKYLYIVGILRDWDYKIADRDPDYPQAEAVVAPIPMWPREKTQKFIEDRVRAHVEALVNLPRCTSQETWGGRRCERYCAVNRFCDQYNQARKTGLFEE